MCSHCGNNETPYDPCANCTNPGAWAYQSRRSSIGKEAEKRTDGYAHSEPNGWPGPSGPSLWLQALRGRRQ